MKKFGIIGFSILAVSLLVLGSLNNVVGFQTVNTSQQNLIKERMKQKDLLFQTICDLANNKEVQKTILHSQGNFLTSFPNPELATLPTITKKQLNMMYCLGMVLSRMIGKTRMLSMVKEHPQMIVQTKDKLDSIIGSNSELSKEMTQLSILNCPSCSDSKFIWHFPLFCTILGMMTFWIELVWGLHGSGLLGYYIIGVLLVIAKLLHCKFYY
jgi:hypothetical protein